MTGVGAVDVDAEFIARVRAMVDGLPDIDLDRIGSCQGPRWCLLLDEEGLPVSGVIYDPETDRRVKVRFPLKGEAA